MYLDYGGVFLCFVYVQDQFNASMYKRIPKAGATRCVPVAAGRLS